MNEIGSTGGGVLRTEDQASRGGRSIGLSQFGIQNNKSTGGHGEVFANFLH